MTVTSLSASSHGSQPVVEQVMNIPRWPPFAPTSNVAALCGTFHRRQDAFGREWGLTKWEEMQLWPPSPALRPNKIHQQLTLGTPMGSEL